MRPRDIAATLLALANTETAELATMVCLASRIEPELIRLARHRLLPQLDAGVEADLWFSPLVQTRSAQAIVLLPEVAAKLRARLAERQEALDSAWKLLEEVHATVSPALLLEEEVTYRSLSQRPSDKLAVDTLLQKVANVMGDQERGLGLARWAARALPRLPEAAQQSATAALLAVGASTWLGGQPILNIQVLDPLLLRLLPLVLPPKMGLESIGIRLVEGGIEFGPVTMQGAHAIQVPRTNPLLLQISLAADEHRQSHLVVLEPGKRETVRVGPGEVTITTAAGQVYVLNPQRLDRSLVNLHLECFIDRSALDSHYRITATTDANLDTPTSVTGPLRLDAPGTFRSHTISDIYIPDFDYETEFPPTHGALPPQRGEPPLVERLQAFRAGVSDPDLFNSVGGGLFALFPPEVQHLFQAIWARAEAVATTQLRITIRCGFTDLAVLPWEALRWISDSRRGREGPEPPEVSVVRLPHIPISAPSEARPFEKPSILLWNMATARQGVSDVADIARELRKLIESLQSPPDLVARSGYIQDLRGEFSERFSILHLVVDAVLNTGGEHGDSGSLQGALLVTNERLSPRTLIDLLRAGNPGLVILNPVTSAPGTTLSALNMLAQDLIGYVPFVLVMQRRLNRKTQVAFLRAFYEALLAGENVERSVEAGRRVLMDMAPTGRVSSTAPVLYARQSPLHVPDAVRLSPATIEVDNFRNAHNYREALRVQYMTVSQQFVSPAFGSPARQSSRAASATTSIEDLLQVVDKREWLTLLGRPGIGLTWLLQYLAFRLAAVQADEESAPLPIYLDMAEWVVELKERSTLIGAMENTKDDLSFLNFAKLQLARSVDGQISPAGEALAARLDEYLTSRQQQRRLVFLLDNFHLIPVDSLELGESLAWRAREILYFAATHPTVGMVVAMPASEYTREYKRDMERMIPRHFRTYSMDLWGEKQIQEYFRLNAPELAAYGNDKRVHNLANRPVHVSLLAGVLKSAGSGVDALLDQPLAIVKWFLLDPLLARAGGGATERDWQATVEALLTALAIELPFTGRKLPGISASEAQNSVGQALYMAERATILDRTGKADNPVYHFTMRAFQEYYANSVGGSLLRSKMWRSGLALHVYFMDGDPALHERVISIARQWVEGTSLSLEVVNDPKAEIRVSFAKPEAWSYLGTDALIPGVEEPTMNIGGLTLDTPAEELQRIVLYEFGHVLGLINEMHNPAAFIPWDREAVYKLFAPSWSRVQIERNLFARYEKNLLISKRFDPQSIMLSPIWSAPPELTFGVLKLAKASTLSPVDRQYILAAYGPANDVPESRTPVEQPVSDLSSSSTGQSAPTTTRIAGTVTWLHLSDWRQDAREQDFEREVMRQALLTDIRRRADISPDLARVDFVVFSGDVSNSGGVPEFDIAGTGLFDPILSALGLERDKLFIVPGNHDQDRNRLPRLLDQNIRPELLYELLQDDETLNSLLAPFAAFSDFARNYTGQQNAAFVNVRRFETNGTTIGLMGLNSALFSYRDLHLIGERQVSEALRATEGVGLRIAVLHHPLGWLAARNQDRGTSLLTNNCHFILHGHSHKPAGMELTVRDGQDCIIIASGSPRADAFERDSMANYNFVHLDGPARKGVAYLRSWSKSRQEWTVAPEMGEKGAFSFTLEGNVSEQAGS